MLPPTQRVKQITWRFGRKGYGDREQELAFVAGFFKEIFAQFPQLTSFAWSQYQDYNDEYYHFDLESYQVNGIYEVDIFGFDWWNENEDWNYRFDYDESKEALTLKQDLYAAVKDWDARNKQVQQETQHLREPVDAMIIFLKACYDFYKPFYFIYLFGRRANVIVTAKGITVDTEEINYIDGEEDDYKFFLNVL